ncbi:MAG: ATP-binding protein [Steroidobacteraceae bacterium]|nr:ATP-binding protein [Steroidobacteraceae bacterium]
MKIRPRPAQQRFIIDDSSKIGEARRAAQTLANYEFDAETAAEVAIAASELATNLHRHARNGEILLQILGSADAAVIELLAIDRGPGMSDVSRCLSDGYSTGGTAGTGLGAVRRLANDFDIHSVPGEGTIVMARFGRGVGVRYGVVSIALEGEIDCGDGWSILENSEGVSVFVVDGLGHGTFAAEAAQAGIGAFAANPFIAPHEILTRANAAMSRTRGGAGACARIVGDKVSYAGVGNIAGALVGDGKSQGLVSHNGTLGIHKRTNQQFEYRRTPGAVLAMHSDGISARWDLKSRGDLLARHPAIVAAAIYRDHARGRDDATVVVVA